MLAAPATAAYAQMVKKPAPAEQAGAAKKDPNVALKALDTGTKSYNSGKFEPAIQSLTAALANGGLPPPKMAQAYYYRGMSYKKQKKPAQALSDLTVAVWVNGGLSEADRAAAMDARNEVYREAGLGDQAPPIANAVGTPSPAATAAAPAAAAPAATPAAPSPAPVAAAPVAPPPAPPASTPPPAPFATEVTAAKAPPAAAPATPPAERPVWQADANAAPPPPMPMPATGAPAAVAPEHPAVAASGKSDAYVPPSSPAPVATLSPAPGSGPAMTPVSGLTESSDPATAQPQSQSSDMLAPIANAGSSISGFFSNMFGQSSGDQQVAATGSTGGAVDGPGWVKANPSTPEGPVAQVSASEPQRAPGYEVAAASPQHRAPAAEAAAPKMMAANSSAGGKYRLQLASVRSREEADRLVQNLMSAHASQLGGAEAQIDEAVIGNMGTFYRVRLGPYANANEPKKLCTTLKPQGYDCQVVTQ
ncbi:MAG: SPOR domain-containing protein [Hyphomicrobiaceae bacterium]|nr:SPOR domain-containing protein [Hyphomicrobiaceae bacterium]